MIKYFIEDEQGFWLMSPELPIRTDCKHGMACWTRNPTKALSIDTRECPMQNNLFVFINRETENVIVPSTHEFIGDVPVMKSDNEFGTLTWVYHPLFDGDD